MRQLIVCICILSLFLILIFPTNVKAEEITVEEIFDNADNFIEKGGGENEVNKTINDVVLTDTSKFLYNALLSIAMIIAVIVGMVLGIKYMLATSEEKAEVKQTVPAYIVSCIVVFGALLIWKTLINIIQ